jgi:hypothetical protein
MGESEGAAAVAIVSARTAPINDVVAKLLLCLIAFFSFYLYVA